MNEKLIILGIVVLLLSVGLSGCVQRKTPVSEEKVDFKIEDVWVTEVSSESKLIIVSITIENKEDKWLAVSTPIMGGLIDNEGNNYFAEMFVEINGSTHYVGELTLIDEDEIFDLVADISPNSTILKKIVFTIPIKREPKRLKLDYGFRENKETLVKDWFDLPEMELPSSQEKSMDDDFWDDDYWDNFWNDVETPVSEGKVNFSVEDVIVTSELEVTTQEWVNLSLVNVTKTELLNDSEVVIISVLIENKEDRILEVAEFWNEGLTDDKGNRYYHKMFIEVNDTTYSIEDITSIEEEEVFGGDILGMSEDFSPNSTNLRKIVYEIPPERVPEKLILTYGFKDHELTDVEDWFDIELQLPS